jgi:tetratricopeptide (TPR) repeat protein
VELNASHINASYRLGYIYKNRGDFKKAMHILERANKVDPEDEFIVYSLAACYRKLGMLDKAISLEKKPIGPYREKINCLLTLGRYDEALTTANALLALKKDALNHYLRGEANEKLGNSQAAINDYQMAVRLNSRYIDPRLALAGIYMEGDRLTDAINECNTILSLDNKNTQAYLLRSKVYVKQLNMPDAINDISRILLIEPENADMFFLRGQYYQMFNQNINAITDFTKAISLRPDDPEIFMARAKSYEEILDYKSAEKDYKKITQLTENNAMVKRLK